MKLLRLLGNFWETHNWIYNFLRDFEPTGVMTVMSNFRILGTLKMTRNDWMLVEGVCPKMGAVSTNFTAKTLWTHGSSAILLLDKPAHTWGRLRYVHSACWSTCRQNMWSHTYLTMVKGAHISSHFFSDNIGEPWLRKAMAAETHGFGHKISHCRGLARHCRRGRGQETIFYDVFPFIPGMVPTPDHPRLIR